jgi:hypothetical protein
VRPESILKENSLDREPDIAPQLFFPQQAVEKIIPRQGEPADADLLDCFARAAADLKRDDLAALLKGLADARRGIHEPSQLLFSPQAVEKIIHATLTTKGAV